MINKIFRELLYEGVLANCMDDFVIPAKTMKKLEKQTIQFLKIAEKHNLCFKRSKCDFNMEEILILGVVIGKGQVQMKEEKIKAVKEWKIPTKVKKVESFLGFANFYRWFIKNFYYNLRLGSCCNLGKDLRKNGKDVQLVKCKEYRVVSILYIIMSHEESIHST